MLFLVFLVVACANGHQTEPGHHVIPYKGKYCIKIILFPLLFGKKKKFFFEKCHERNITEKSSNMHKIALNCREVYNNTHRKYITKSCDVPRQLKVS